MKKIALLLGVLGCALLGEAIAQTYYAHSISLGVGECGSAILSLNQGDIINISAANLNGDRFRVEIYNPFGEKVFSASSHSTLNKTYKIPVTGEYELRICSGVIAGYVTVEYTITRTYTGHFGITRHQDITLA